MQDRVGVGSAWSRKFLEVTSLLGHPRGLTRLGLESRDKTHAKSRSCSPITVFPPHQMKTGCEGGKGYCKRKTVNRKYVIINMEAFTVQDSWHPGPSQDSRVKTPLTLALCSALLRVKS